MKICVYGKIPREEAPVLQGFRTPAASATTSELQAGNGLPGAPVTASMSDGCAVTRVEPWNTSVSHP